MLFCFLFILSIGCSKNDDTLPPRDDLPELKSAYAPSSAVIDDFNDGLVNDIWELGTSEGATVIEEDGVLNIVIDGGTTSQGGNQVGGLTTKDYIIQGDFDIQIDYHLCEDYHQIEERNTLLMLIDQTGEGLEISIRTGVYLSVESYMTIESTPTEHLDGTLRIERKNNTVTTYYWDNGWVIHAQWEPSVVVAEDLRITFFSWNWEPSYSALETQLDNLILNHGFIIVCHNPETDNQKTLRLPAAALGAHLAHGDYIGECECWEIRV